MGNRFTVPQNAAFVKTTKRSENRFMSLLSDTNTIMITHGYNSETHEILFVFTTAEFLSIRTTDQPSKSVPGDPSLVMFKMIETIGNIIPGTPDRFTWFQYDLTQL
jgi:hypothetical protein